MDPKIMCLKCGSYIHNTERCWKWEERRLCKTDRKYKESCDCNDCVKKEICPHCNYWVDACDCADERCSICNEQLEIYNTGSKCYWDHTKSPCKFCNLPISESFDDCPNYHHVNSSLCKECNMPEVFSGNHKHDGSVCKKCGTLLNEGSCIYNCVNGGNRCLHCYSEGVVNNVCWNYCGKDQTGFLTKAAIK